MFKTSELHAKADPADLVIVEPSFAEFIEWSKIPHVPYDSLRCIRRRVGKFVPAHSSTRVPNEKNHVVRPYLERPVI